LGDIGKELLPMRIDARKHTPEDEARLAAITAKLFKRPKSETYALWFTAIGCALFALFGLAADGPMLNFFGGLCGVVCVWASFFAIKLTWPKTDTAEVWIAVACIVVTGEAIFAILTA
jgi:hypothetical protein